MWRSVFPLSLVESPPTPFVLVEHSVHIPGPFGLTSVSQGLDWTGLEVARPSLELGAIVIVHACMLRLGSEICPLVYSFKVFHILLSWTKAVL